MQRAGPHRTGSKDLSQGGMSTGKINAFRSAADQKWFLAPGITNEEQGASVRLIPGGCELAFHASQSRGSLASQQRMKGTSIALAVGKGQSERRHDAGWAIELSVKYQLGPGLINHRRLSPLVVTHQRQPHMPQPNARITPDARPVRTAPHLSVIH